MNQNHIKSDFFLTVVEHMGECLCVTNQHGKIQFVNPAADKLLVQIQKNFQDKNFFDLIGASERWRWELNEQVIKLGLTLRGDELELKGEDGPSIAISYTVTSGPAADDQTQLIFLFRDVTRRKQLNQRLKMRENQLKIAQKAAKFGSWDWDLLSNTVLWTNSLFQLYGYQPDEVTPSYELAMHHIHPEDREAVEVQIQQAVQEHAPFTYTCRLLRADGQERMMNVHGSMRFDKQDELIHMWGTARDVTELHHITGMQRRTQKFAERLVDSSLHGIIAFDDSLEYLLWNPVMESLTGLPAAEILGRTVPECFPMLVEDGEIEKFYRAIAGEELIQPEYVYTHWKTGRQTYVEIHYGPLLDEDGDIIGGLIFVRDITAHRQALQDLQHSEERFRTMFEAAEIGIVLLDTRRRILDANPAWEAMSGVEKSAADGRELFDFIREEDVEPLAAGLDEILTGRRSSAHLELQIQLDSREPLWLSGIFSRLDDFEGQPLRIICTLENITPRKLMEDELTQVKRELARSRENERVYLAQELHDGPIQDLYATNYQLQALKRLVDAPQSAHLVDNVLNQFQQVNDTLRAICQDLRPPALAAFGLEAALRSHAERFQKLYPDLTISLDLDRDEQRLPEYVRLTLFRIAQEMLSNVAKHAAATQVLIRFELNPADLLLEIQDNGRGFDVPARWIKLVREGHLGLLGASERAEEIDGTLTILSTPGQGTIIRVTAPRVPSEVVLSASETEGEKQVE